MRPRVSIIIPTFNSASVIEDCLKSLLHQSYETSEIIVIDGCSADTTALRANALADNSPKIRVIVQARNEGPSAARNIGILSADSEILCFVDSDCVAHEHWVEEIQKRWDLASNKVGGIRGKVLPQDTDLLTRVLSNGLYISEIHRGATDNISYRKNVLIETGLFDPQIRINEDADLALRVRERGYEIVYCDTAVVFHDYKFNIERFLKREFKFGRGFFILWKKSRDIRTITPVLLTLSAVSLLGLSLFTNLGLFLVVMAISLVYVSFSYRSYFKHFLRQMNVLYLPLLLIVYALKSMCNSFGFFSELFYFSKKPPRHDDS